MTARKIPAKGAAAYEVLSTPVGKRDHVNIGMIESKAGIAGCEDYGSSARQDLRQPMRHFAPPPIELRERLRRTAA